MHKVNMTNIKISLFDKRNIGFWEWETNQLPFWETRGTYTRWRNKKSTWWL